MNCSDSARPPSVAAAADDHADHRDYDYDLPPELIAQEPCERRTDSRLLVVERNGNLRAIERFRDLPDWLRTGDTLVVNDSRVIPARLWLRRASGGRVELLLVRPLADVADAVADEARDGAASSTPWLALARPVRRLRVGEILTLDCGDQGDEVELVARHDDGFVTVRAVAADLGKLAERHGEMPLPPYIERDPGDVRHDQRRRLDRERYQTVYACSDPGRGGSVAAPTAGLHFSPPLLRRLDRRGVAVASVRLHVGPGTFKPPTDSQYRVRRLHGETFHMPAATAATLAATRRRGGRIFAVGTTSLRVLETVARLHLAQCSSDEVCFPAAADAAVPGELTQPLFTGRARRGADGWSVTGETRLFVRPPDTVTAADGLLTNFHLPGSSLVMLVAAFAGRRTWRRAYAEAVARRLRFYSYGDAMLILPAADGGGDRPRTCAARRDVE